MGLTIHHHFVGKTAGLSTFASVSTALAEGFTRQTLPGIGDAKGAMHENLQRHHEVPLGQLRLQALEITKGKFTGQHNPLTTKRCSLGNPR